MGNDLSKLLAFKWHHAHKSCKKGFWSGLFSNRVWEKPPRFFMHSRGSKVDTHGQQHYSCLFYVLRQTLSLTNWQEDQLITIFDCYNSHKQTTPIGHLNKQTNKQKKANLLYMGKEHPAYRCQQRAGYCAESRGYAHLASWCPCSYTMALLECLGIQ